MSNSRITVLEAPRLQGGTFHRGWPQGPRREGPQGEIKITNTLVEIPRDAASDAGSTPAASTNLRVPPQGDCERQRRQDGDSKEAGEPACARGAGRVLCRCG